MNRCSNVHTTASEELADFVIGSGKIGGVPMWIIMMTLEHELRYDRELTVSRAERKIKYRRIRCRLAQVSLS